MAVAKKEKKSHVFMGNNSFRCFNCGEELFFPVSSKGGGWSIPLITGLCKLVNKDHAKCKPSAEGKARFEYKTPEEWFKSWDTGASSLVIYAAMTGQAVTPSFPRPPSDPSDFGRCYRLLALVTPEQRRQALQAVLRHHESWRPMLAVWNELTALWEEEHKSPDGMAPKLYKRLQELRV